MDTEKVLKIKDAVLRHRRITKTGWRPTNIPDPIKAAIGVLGKHWFIKPKLQNKYHGQEYKLERCGIGLHWPDPTWERYQTYLQFEDESRDQTPREKTSKETTKENSHTDKRGRITGYFHPA